MGTINRMRLSLGALVGVIVALAACSSPSSDQPGGTGGVGGTGGSGGGSGGAGGGQCAGSCDDGFGCTIDTCVGGKCTHSIGPNTGSTACPTGQYCAADKGCIASPACASAADCTKIWSGDACKSNIKCDAASSVCTFDVLDKDGDKHSPQICGGDDCDDSAPAVHPGSSEGCNGKDDDCDGVVDNGATCMDALQSCQAGACACKPENLCGKDCVDVATDRKHCGSCDHACDFLEDCTAGQCACRPENLCSGKCVSLGDVENCGFCGNKCPTPNPGCNPVCTNSTCGAICP